MTMGNMAKGHARDSTELRPGREAGLHHKALRRFGLLKKLAADMGIEDERLRRQRVSALETDKCKAVVDHLLRLGPLQPAVEALGRKAAILG